MEREFAYRRTNEGFGTVEINVLLHFRNCCGLGEVQIRDIKYYGKCYRSHRPQLGVTLRSFYTIEARAVAGRIAG
jgi:hypothetical protein